MKFSLEQRKRPRLFWKFSLITETLLKETVAWLVAIALRENTTSWTYFEKSGLNVIFLW